MSEQLNPREEVIEYSNFRGVITGEGDWIPAGFGLPDGGFWQYQEPDAVVIVQDGFLKVAAVPYTRHHDSIQILDNAKHMYFSSRNFTAPESGSITFAVDMSASIVGGAQGDLYDAFVSFNVLDFSTGAALDFFVGNDVAATVYGKLPFPGVPAAACGHGPRYFCLFEEIRCGITPGSLRHYEITYESNENRITYSVDGAEVRRFSNVPFMLGSCTLALGLMSEKDLAAGRGSVSCHGQGAMGRWGNVKVIRRER
jgi:hypothetical protein